MKPRQISVSFFSGSAALFSSIPRADGKVQKQEENALSLSIIHLCIYSFLAKRVEDPSNLVISWTRKTDLNVTEMHDLHMYHLSRYLNLKGGITIFEP